MRVATVQMTSSENQEENLTLIHQSIQAASKKGADLVALPENCTLLTERRKIQLDHAQSLRGLTTKIFQEWATEYGVWILVGSLPVQTPQRNKVYNCSVLIDSAGELVAHYKKIHLFDVMVSGSRSYKESKTIEAGNKICVVDSPWGRLGLSICYDIRFPELYRQLKADVIFIPSAFTVETGRAHWDILTRARAVENQAYVVAPAQVGQHYPGRETYGHSRIIDPWGRILSEQITGPGIIWADLNFKSLQKIRKNLPALENRRI